MTTRTNLAPSATKRDCTAALEKLLEAEGFQAVLDAFDTAMEGEYANRLSKRFPGTKIRKGGFPKEFLTTAERKDPQVLHKWFPWQDHGLNVMDGRKHIAYVSEPYALHWDALQVLVDSCRERGLEADVSPHGTHFPGHTLGVVVTRPARSAHKGER